MQCQAQGSQDVNPIERYGVSVAYDAKDINVRKIYPMQITSGLKTRVYP